MSVVLAYAVLKGRQWVIARCPFCGKRHRHGAGPPDGDPRKFLGSRVPHCCGGDDQCDDVYVLVEEEVSQRDVE